MLREGPINQGYACKHQHLYSLSHITINTTQNVWAYNYAHFTEKCQDSNVGQLRLRLWTVWVFPLTSSSSVGIYCVILEATPHQSVNHLLPPLLWTQMLCTYSTRHLLGQRQNQKTTQSLSLGYRHSVQGQKTSTHQWIRKHLTDLLWLTFQQVRKDT